MNEWHYWFNGQIFRYPTQEIPRQAIEGLIGYKFNEINCAFPDSLHAVILYSNHETESRVMLTHKAIELKADCIICKFYYPLYQWQCLSFDELQKHLQHVKYVNEMEDSNGIA